MPRRTCVAQYASTTNHASRMAASLRLNVRHAPEFDGAHAEIDGEQYDDRQEWCRDCVDHGVAVAKIHRVPHDERREQALGEWPPQKRQSREDERQQQGSSWPARSTVASPAARMPTAAL